MKKLLLYMGCAVAMLSACDPNDDFIDTLNSEAKAAGIDMPETLILEEGDYSIVEKSDMFASIDEAKNLIPQILTDKYAANTSNEGNLMNVFYDYYRGDSDEYANYKNEHEVSEDEYTAVGGVIADLGYFTADVKSDDNANEILSAAYPDAVKGDVQKYISQGAASKSYKYEDVSIEAVEKYALEKADFQVMVDAVLADDDNKHLVNEDGDFELYYGANSKYGNFEGRTSKWAAKDEYKDMSEDDLEDLIEDRQAEACIIALKAALPDATILDAEGKKISYLVDYDTYDGSSKTITLRLECTGEGVDLAFENKGQLYVNTKHEFYMFDGDNWLIEDAIYRLSSDDYNAMGEDYGFPGKYDNFDSGMDVDRYLTVLLNDMDKFALDGDTKIIAYKYYTSGVTELRADEYTFTTEMGWQITATVANADDKFVFKAKTGWEVIIITTYEFSDDDYALTGDEKYKNFGYYDDKAGTFKDVEVENVLQAKINLVLTTNFPDAVEGSLFEVTYNYYSSGATTAVKKRYQKIGDVFVLVVE
jgi:hypothetical protein